MRRSVLLTTLTVTGVGVLGALAVADALRSARSPSTLATSTSTTPSVSTEEEAVTVANDSSEEEIEEIERIGNAWAVRFAAGPLPAACRYETQPLCERITCQRVGGVKIRKCTRPTSALRNAFFGASVQDIEIRGHRAAARFSNGVVIELYGDAGTWSIHKLGGRAGSTLFE